MREWTDEMVREEVGHIVKEDWPLWPILPMKRTDRSLFDEGSLGIVVSGQLAKVYVITLGDLIVGKTLREQLEGVPSHTFDSVEDMVRDGWIGD